MKLQLQKIVVWPICLFFLFGIIFTGDSNILCLGENGQVKFEALCLPDNCVADDCSENDFQSDFQNLICDYSHCSDIEFSGPARSRPVQKIDSDKPGQFAQAFSCLAFVNQSSAEIINLKNIKFYLAYGQSPPSFSVSTTVIRC